MLVPLGMRSLGVFDIWLHYSLILLKYLYLFKICMQFVNLTAAAFAVSPSPHHPIYLCHAFFNCHLCCFFNFIYYIFFVAVALPLRLIAFCI